MNYSEDENSMMVVNTNLEGATVYEVEEDEVDDMTLEVVVVGTHISMASLVSAIFSTP